MFHFQKIDTELKRYKILSLKIQIVCQTVLVEVVLEPQGFDRLQMTDRSVRSLGAAFSGQTAVLRIRLIILMSGITKGYGLLNLVLR